MVKVFETTANGHNCYVQRPEYFFVTGFSCFKWFASHHLSDLQPIKTFKQIVWSQLKERFPFHPERKTVLGTAFDLRYHHMTCFSVEEQLEVQEQWKTVMKSYMMNPIHQ